MQVPKQEGSKSEKHQVSEAEEGQATPMCIMEHNEQTITERQHSRSNANDAQIHIQARPARVERDNEGTHRSVNFEGHPPGPPMGHQNDGRTRKAKQGKATLQTLSGKQQATHD